MSLIMLNQENESACQDGTPTGYYFSEGEGSGKDKFLIYFQGGGWCTGANYDNMMSDCLARMKGDLGSSKNWAKEFHGSGIFDNQIEKNPIFYNWNKIYILYCDGSSHQGYQKQPVLFKDTKIYFRGFNNTAGTFNDLFEKKGLGSATEVVLSGGSAGGRASLYWADYLQDKLLMVKNCKFSVISDSSFIIDTPNLKSKTYLTRQEFKTLANVSNPDNIHPNLECSKNIDQFWKCFLLEYLSIYIKTKNIFLVYSQYDGFSIPNCLGMYCQNGSSLQGCSKDQISQINIFRQQILQDLGVVLSQHQNWGGWFISCMKHVFTGDDSFNSPKWTIPGNSELTLNKAIQNWRDQLTNQELYPDEKQYQQQIAYFDKVDWPDNHNCAGISKYNQQ